MSEPNWKALAVELAEAINGDYSAKDGIYDKAASVLALAKPEELLPWPGLKGKPQVYGHAEHGFYVLQSEQGVWTHHGPLCLTRDAAIAEWNKVVRAIRGGVDEETQRLVSILRRYCDNNGIDHGVELIDDWLARHPKGGGA